MLSADIVSSSQSGTVSAVFDAFSSSDSSLLPVDSLSESVSAQNSLTTAALAWSWNGTTLTGNSTLTAEKTVAAKPGGAHQADSSFAFTFTIDAAATYVLDGLWGFNGAVGNNDPLSLSLSGPSGTLFTDFSTGITGIGSDSFFASGLLLPGTYTLAFAGQLIETINNQKTVAGGWIINQFTISTVAVPEPCTASLSGVAILLAGLIRRQNRPPIASAQA
jgi:hypothetical protein